MTTKPNEPEAMEPCPFCGAPLFFNGNKMNPYGRCETEGCWMHDRKCTVPTDDPWQVGQWNRRAPANPVADAGGVTNLDWAMANACRPWCDDMNEPEVADLFAAHRIQSVAAATAKLQDRIDELTNEAEIFDQDHADQNRMVDRIADLIGLPQDQELDTVAFELWISAQTAATAAKDAALRLARPIVEADYCDAKDYCDGDWEGMTKTALDAIDAALSEAREAGDSLSAGDRV